MSQIEEVTGLAELAVRLARSAGNILSERSMTSVGQLETKSSSVDIVTAADHASEDHIVSVLRQERPNDSLVGEEGAFFEGANNVRWVVDPLDGTVNFTYGRPEYSVSIGVEIDGMPSVGAVFAPALDEMFTAVRGGGAFLNGSPIKATGQRDLNQALVATGFSYVAGLRAQEAHRLTRVLPVVRDIRRNGSAALELCAVACGRVDAFYEAVLHPWDVSAGTVIASEAGALVTGMEGGKASTDIVAANPELHGKLMTLLASGK